MVSRPWRGSNSAPHFICS